MADIGGLAISLLFFGYLIQSFFCFDLITDHIAGKLFKQKMDESH